MWEQDNGSLIQKKNSIVKNNSLYSHELERQHNAYEWAMKHMLKMK